MTVDRHVGRDGVKQARNALDRRLAPPTITFPDDWTMSTAWERAQRAAAICAPTGPAAFRVLMGYIDHDGHGDEHEVTFTIYDGDLIADCSCAGFSHSPHRHWCAHVARLWWEWVRDDLAVTDLDTRRVHTSPPWWLRVDDHDAPTPTSASRGVARTDGGERR
ncbi:hypothetical protein [Halorubellus litoreus]|uniref:SWIM-type domain-containing protein n=1 Tax=Halorubellus litoreus TaxID=755308 RepID=A0ABD5VHG0_9EURY